MKNAEQSESKQATTCDTVWWVLPETLASACCVDSDSTPDDTSAARAASSSRNKADRSSTSHSWWATPCAPARQMGQFVTITTPDCSSKDHHEPELRNTFFKSALHHRFPRLKLSAAAAAAA